jgi:hypothetical protein
MVDGKEKRLILKRQQNHTSRTVCHPVRGVPTFWKELYNILRFKQLGIAVVEPVYFCRRRTASGTQAILVTEYLEGYTPLDEWVGKWHRGGGANRLERDRLIKAVAVVVSKIHAEGMQHNCLYPNHLFVRQVDSDIQVRLIDLEKARWRPLGMARRVRDLESLHRHTAIVSRSDRLRFLLAYGGVARLDNKSKELHRRIVARHRKKQTRYRSGTRNSERGIGMQDEE